MPTPRFFKSFVKQNMKTHANPYEAPNVTGPVYVPENRVGVVYDSAGPDGQLAAAPGEAERARQVALGLDKSSGL